MKLDPVGKVLVRAAELIAERGHCKGEYSLKDGSCCPIGALLILVGGREFNDATNALKQAVSNDIATWNDLPERTPEEVIDGLIHAAYWRLP